MNKLSKLQYFYYHFVFSNRFFRKVKALIDIVIFMVFKPKGVSVWTGARHLDYTFEKGDIYPDGLFITQEGELGVMKRGASVIAYVGSGYFVYDEKKLHEEKPMGFTATSLLFALVLSASVALAWNGSGTYEDPYEINTASDVADLVSAVNGGASQSGVYFLQTADIDLSPFGNFTPVGLPAAPFSGAYDGDGYILSNLTITANVPSTATTNAFGLFGYCENATIENVSVYGKISVWADYNANACVGVGGVIGLSIKGLFVALENYCDIDLKLSNADISSASSGDKIKYGVGGCIGLIATPPTSSTQYQSCENYGDVSFEGMNWASCIGGCVSAFGSKMTFAAFNNFGNVFATNAGSLGNGTPLCSGVVCSHNNINDAYPPTAKSCSNFGVIVSSNGVHTAGIIAKGLSVNGAKLSAISCTNYGSVVAYPSTSRVWGSGVAVAGGNYTDDIVYGCVNFGKIKAVGDKSGIPQLSGIFSGNLGYSSASVFHNNKNFGDIEADTPNASSVVVGGVMSAQRKIRIRDSENHGNISIKTDGSVLVGGVASVSSQGYMFSFARNCVNLGSITADGNSNTNYSPCVGGVFASTRQTNSNTREFVISNCYNLGTAKLNLNDDGCYGAIYGVANTYGNYGVSIKNCYAVVGEGQSLIGAVDSSAGDVIIENCVGIKCGRTASIAASVSGTRYSDANTELVAYDDCYHTPSLCLGNMFSGFFYPAEKTTTFFDLVLPINTALFPTPTDADKTLHNYTKAMGYKRYIRTIQQ